MKDIHARVPIDATAARVMQPGTHYEKQGAWSEELFDAPPAMRHRMPNDPQALRKGHVFGWLTVIGIAVRGASAARYVCRCRCGKYCLRSAKALKPVKDNTQFACSRCCHARQLRRRQTFKETGVWPEHEL
jgi:hypothetical protein